MYWDQGEYLAIGCAAHGHTGGRRWWNVRTPDRYIERDHGGDVAGGRVGALARCRARGGGVHARAPHARRRGPVAGSEHVLADLAADGLCAFVGERVVLTRSGRLLANEVTAPRSLRIASVSGQRPAG